MSGLEFLNCGKKAQSDHQPASIVGSKSKSEAELGQAGLGSSSDLVWNSRCWGQVGIVVIFQIFKLRKKCEGP